MDPRNTANFRAVAGDLEAFGATPADAVTALMQRLPQGAPGPIVIWPCNQSDVTEIRGRRVVGKPGGYPGKAEIKPGMEEAFDQIVADRG